MFYLMLTANGDAKQLNDTNFEMTREVTDELAARYGIVRILRIVDDPGLLAPAVDIWNGTEWVEVPRCFSLE